jgi:acyl-CoA dehydrogenase
MPPFANSPFNETHEQVRATVRRFVEKHVRPHIHDWEEAGIFPREIYQLAGDAGILGIGYADKWGGSGAGDVLMKVAASEELMRSTSGGFVASLGSLDIGLPPIEKWAKPALRETIVPAALRGEKIVALAITEPGGGSDVAALKTRARKDGDHYVVNGSKTFITSGTRADYFTVAVRTGGEGHGGISLLVIERGTPGFSTGKKLQKMGWWASDTAELFFEDCRVPVANLIGNFLMERLSLAVMAYMTAQIAYEEALRYVRERDAFGRKIGKFQVIKHKLVDMASRVEIARQYTLMVAQKIQAKQNCITEVSMAKNFATDTADFVTYEAVQIFGGMGYMRESVVERLYRDARILPIGGGTTEIMKEIIAKQLGL